MFAYQEKYQRKKAQFDWLNARATIVLVFFIYFLFLFIYLLYNNQWLMSACDGIRDRNDFSNIVEGQTPFFGAAWMEC